MKFANLPCVRHTPSSGKTNNMTDSIETHSKDVRLYKILSFNKFMKHNSFIHFSNQLETLVLNRMRINHIY